MKVHNKIIFLLLILFISIGFAYLTRDLTLSGISSIFGNTWDVHFDNVVVSNGSVEANTPVIDTDRTSVSFTVEFSTPGDFYEFTVDAVNGGTIDAMLNTYTSSELDESIANLLEYTVTYADGEELAQYQELNAGDSLTYKIRLYYKLDISEDDLPDSNIPVEITFTTDYVQADSNRIQRYAETHSLYNVLKNEAESGGLAKKYTGVHQDSMDASKSTKDVYHWYANNNADGALVNNKNNVIFANHCWHMIRTTDTGGVKMIYNGEVDNNQCLDTRSAPHVIYSSHSTENLLSNYWYGTDYIYDSTNNSFSIYGNTEQVTWNESTASGLIGKYTCKSTSENGTCNTLYLVESFYNASSAYVFSLVSNSNYRSIGKLPFNINHFSPSDAGYMYGDVYTSNIGYFESFQHWSDAQEILKSSSLSTSYWYADSINYSSTSGRYSMIDAYQVSSTDEFSNLVGKYTFRQSYDSTSYDAYYIAGVNGSTMYYKLLKKGDLISIYQPIVFGDSITDNGNGTYTLNNSISVSLTDWYTNYMNYKNIYTCNSLSSSCSDPRYIISSYANSYGYLNAIDKILISKSRNGLYLNDTILVSKVDWYNNYSNYSDYKYTCNTDSSICTEDSLRLIISYLSNGYSYTSNRYFGSSVTWDGTNYNLVNPIELENYNNINNISTHHYICLSNGKKSCSSVAYIYYYTGNSGFNTFYYIILKDGVLSVSEAINDMFTKNTNNSVIKSGIDAWYKHYLLEKYDSYIEDTIFCNNRSFNGYLGYAGIGGWDENDGDVNEYMEFGDHTDPLICRKVTDRFSVSNNDAKLTYKVGLMSSNELSLSNNKYTRYYLDSYWTLTPSDFNGFFSVDGVKPKNYCVSIRYSSGNDSGLIKTDTIRSITTGVRPAISLKSNVFYSSGNGSKESPYIVFTN